MKHSSTRGFTLIELLVVIAIIGILSSVVLASLNSARMKSRDARRIADLKQVQTALELYYDGNQSYPVVGTIGTVGTVLTALSGSYIPALPADPQGTNAYQYQSMTGTTTTACSTSPCSGYVLKATLEDSANAALSNDVDGTVGTATCNDPGYCVRP
jgi:prepilin-type N-terminal cleavage/methylation domain-containing protein